MSQEIKIKLVIDGKEAEATFNKAQLGLDETKTKAKEVSGSFEQIKNTAIGNFLASQFQNAIAGLKQLVAQSTELAAIQEKADAKIRQLVETTGGAAGLSYEDLKRQAAALQEITTFGDEAIQGLQAKLLTFKSIQGDIFEDVIKLSLDTGELFGSAEGAVLQYGKAFEDPKNGLMALRRVGISFDEQQKEQIFTLQESGRLMEAQAVLADILKGQLGGVAEAMAQTDSGKIQQFNNRLADTQERLGFVIQQMKVGMLPAWDALLNVTNDLLGANSQKSEQLKQEQSDLNVLVSRITDVNTKQEDRLSLLNDMQDTYPDFLGNLDIEKVTNEELAKSLQRVNEEFINRIMLQQQEEKIASILGGASSAMDEKLRKENELRKAVIEANNEYNLGVQTTGVSLSKMVEQMENELSARRGQVGGLRVSRSELQKLNTEVAQRKLDLGEVYILENEYKSAMSEANEQVEIKNRLLEELGIKQDGVNSSINSGSDALEQNEVLLKRAQELHRAMTDSTLSFSEATGILEEELKTLRDQQGPSVEVQEEIAQIEAKLKALKDLQAVQQALRDESFKPELEAPEDVLIDDLPSNEDLDIDVESDPIVRMYERRELSALRFNDLQDQLANLEETRRKSTNKAYIASLGQQIEATELAIAAEQRRMQAASAIGRAIGQQLEYAKSVKDGAKEVLKALAAEISALFIRNALQTAGASGPLALVVAPVLIAAAKVLAGAAIDSIPGFATGGFPSGRNTLIRVNEQGQEGVVNAPATAQARGLIEFMNAGPGNARFAQEVVNNAQNGTFSSESIKAISKENEVGPTLTNQPVVNVTVHSTLNNTISARNVRDELQQLDEIETLVGN